MLVEHGCALPPRPTSLRGSVTCTAARAAGKAHAEKNTLRGVFSCAMLRATGGNHPI